MTTTKRRRTKGEGSITKMANSKYRVRLDCGYVDGKRKQLSGTADSLAEARVLLRGFMKLREEADVAVSMNMTFEALAKNFLEYKRTRDVIRGTSLYAYEKIINNAIKSFGTKTLSKITTKDIDEHILKLRRQELKESTIRTHLTVLGIVFHYAIKALKILAVSPLEGHLYVDTHYHKSEMEILSESEFEALRCVLKRYYDESLMCLDRKPSATALLYIAFMIAYETGMRKGEILGLRWSRINFSEHTILVDNQRVHIKKRGTIDSVPKTLSSKRTIIISEGLIEILTKHKASFQFSEQDDYVFSKDFNGTRVLEASSLRIPFNQCLKEAGITRRFTFHMIRHTNATRLIELSGNDYKTVSERLGHSSVTITFNVYAHTIKKQHQLAANLMDCTK